MISINPSAPKFRDQPECNLMLSYQSLPQSPILSTSTHRFRALKFAPKLVFPHSFSFPVSEAHRRFPTKKWKILCFRHEEFLSGSPNSDYGEKILQESEKSGISKPNFEKRNWVTNFREAVDALLKVIGKRWTVPWTAETILQVTLLWIMSFWFIGSWMIPFAAHITGFSKESLTFRGQALFSLLTDVTEGLAGILILYRSLSRFHPLSSDWFKFTHKGKWPFDVLLGCSMFPLVNRLSQFNLDLLPVLPSTPLALSSVEQSIVARDPIAMALYALVLVVCAPLWEEIVFRGFLLPSLTKYMPVWCSILVSSVAFALAHFNVQRMLPLIFLGVVMGVTYTSLSPGVVEKRWRTDHQSVMEAIPGLWLTVNFISKFANDDEDARSWIDSVEIIHHLYFGLREGASQEIILIDCNLTFVSVVVASNILFHCLYPWTKKQDYFLREVGAYAINCY